MIVKRYAPRKESDPRRAAGVRAERRMAQYLDRYFGDHETMHVLHDLRLEFEGDVAQIDHLVLHPFGAAIVESKSVTTAVRINAADEWERRWRSRWEGMPDPLLQGERQGILLRRLLESRTSDLLDKVVFGLLQGTFRMMAVDVFAAISDEGTIRRARRDQAPRAFKADAVPNAVADQVHTHRKAASLLNPNLKTFNGAPREFKPAEVLRVAHFLRTRSADQAATAAQAPAPPTPREHRRPRETQTPGGRAPESRAPTTGAGEAPESLRCKKCGSTNLEPTIGRYGPYGRCHDCGGNTSVRRVCPDCETPIRMERADAGFAGTCGSCGRVEAVRVAPT